MGFDDDLYNVGLNSTVYKKLKNKKTVRIQGVDYNVEILEVDKVNEDNKTQNEEPNNLMKSVKSNLKKEQIKIEI